MSMTADRRGGSSRLPDAAWRRQVRVLVITELMIGGAAVAGGILLVTAPDGSLLHISVTLLQGSPFADWRVPGLLLAGFVGCGFLSAAWWLWRRLPYAAGLSIAAGAGLIAFEAAELAWIGFQPLQAICAGIGGFAIWRAARLR